MVGFPPGSARRESFPKGRMESVVLDALREGFFARLQDFGPAVPFTGPSASSFSGVLMPMPAIEPSMPLGNDWRELSTLQAFRDDVPDEIQAQSRIANAGDTWKVVRRDDNPADFAVKFWVVKVVPGKDP